MKVILIQDVQGLGKKYDIKEVSDGHARNFLIPNNLVKIATENALLWVETQKEIIAKKAKEDLGETQELASKIDGLELNLKIKVGEKGQLFEKVTPSKIAEKLKEEGFTVDKKQIEIPDSIEKTGEFPVKVKLEHNLEAEIKVIITEEESND